MQTVQLNSKYSAYLHVDKNNSGPSAIVALGPFSRGDLWVHDPEASSDPNPAFMPVGDAKLAVTRTRRAVRQQPSRVDPKAMSNLAHGRCEPPWDLPCSSCLPFALLAAVLAFICSLLVLVGPLALGL